MPRRCGLRRGGGLAALATCLLWPATAAAGTFEFTPDADTYVDSAAPTTSFGASSGLAADGSPVKQAFLRFRVTGLGGRSVTRVRLRMTSRDGSVSGGRVSPIAASSWSESTTYSTRPAITGAPLAAFGAVTANRDYELDLGQALRADGTYAFAIDTASSDGVRWASRETTAAPRLLVDTPDTGLSTDGMALVADGATGSSSPTYYGTNHHLARTSGGRLLTVFGRHATGVAVRWRDPETNWRSVTVGAGASGLLLTGTGTGDWPASVAVGRDVTGEEHAWVVWSRTSPTYVKSVQMVRLSKLDSPSGPTVGAVTTVDAPVGGAYRADIGIERGADGRDRGVLLWSRKVGTGYEVVTGSFDDLAAATPVVSDQTVLVSSTSSSRHGTLEPTALGMRAAVRDASGYLRVFAHTPGSAPTSWTSPAGTRLTADSPSAVALDSGQLLVAFTRSASLGEIRVKRFGSSGEPLADELLLTGYAEPTIASDGTRARLVMVRLADGLVVSRGLDPASGWSASDRVEVAADGGGNHAHPNALRRGGKLLFVVRGPRTSTTSASSVLSVQHPF